MNYTERTQSVITGQPNRLTIKWTNVKRWKSVSGERGAKKRMQHPKAPSATTILNANGLPLSGTGSPSISDSVSTRGRFRRNGTRVINRESGIVLPRRASRGANEGGEENLQEKSTGNPLKTTGSPQHTTLRTGKNKRVKTL